MVERSRRQRLSEMYGELSPAKAGTPVTLRRRLARSQLEHNLKSENDQDAKPIALESRPIEKLISSPGPIIPATVLDVGSQRGFVLVLFAIIQAYKLYDLILLKNNLPVSTLIGFPSQHFNFITKYLLYDSLFIYFLPALRIPALTFSKSIVILQVLLLFFFNLFLASDLSFPLASILFAAWKKFDGKDLTILGGTTSSHYDPSKHFKGSHTIKILPENTAYLNPFHESFCLPLGAKNFQVNVPIRFNSTSEIDFIQIKYTDFDTNTPTLMNYTRKDIRKFITKNLNGLYEKDTISGPNIHYLNLPVKKTGLYEINQVFDSKYLGLRNYRSTLVVPHCPTAEINDISRLPTDQCVGDIDSIKFTIAGVPPLKLKYKKLINQHVQEFDDQSLQPEYFISPLTTYGTSAKYFSKEQLSDLSWAKSRSVQVELENPIKELGDYSYRIEEIVDGLGNLVNFTDSLSNNDDLFKNYDLLHSFFVHDSPRVQLSDKLNRQSKTKRSLHLKIDQNENSAPYEAQIKYTSEDEKISEILTHVFHSENDELKIDRPGIYTLLSVKSKYCPSVISGRSSVSVSLPVVPELSINSKPITDSCVGQVGLTFDFSFVGTPPFTLEQKIYRTDGTHRIELETKRLISQGTRFRFAYEPQSEGHYEIAFTSLMDSLYQEPIQLQPAQDYIFKTSMRVKPSADIYKYHEGNALCLGSRGKIPIHFKGEAPFSLDYDIIETSTKKRIPFSAKDIDSNYYDIITPDFNIGGEYIVSLTAVEDRSGCLVNLNGADAKIKVRREVPSLGFGLSGSNKSKIKEGDKVELPVRLSGEGSFEIEYDHLDTEGNVISTHKKFFRNSYKAAIEVSESGVYKLKSVRDQDCPGVVDGVDTHEILYQPRPSLAITEHEKVTKVKTNVFEKQKVCQFHEDTIDLSLNGSPPFIIDYTIHSPDGRKSSKTISVATKFASIRLVNEKSGEYTYTIDGIYDSLYSQSDLKKIGQRSEVITLSQTVSPSPNVGFKEKRKSYRTCTNSLLEKASLDPIDLSLQGNSPYTVSFEVYHESSSKSEFVTLSNINSHSDLRELYRGLKLGNHIVTIVKVVDSFGCTKEDFPENNYISISISDTPKINHLDSSINYCVGDHIGYQLIGTPPFTIVYSFNGLNLKSLESSSQFIRLASEPGTISVKSLQDSSSNCVVNFTAPEYRDKSDRLDIVVHPIPSVEVSQGDSIIQDINEGDQAEIIFSFEGTPPFSLTYVRIEEVDNRKGKKRSQVVETHTVNGIYAYEYRVLTSLQGTYEAIEVSDAFCVARNE